MAEGDGGGNRFLTPATVLAAALFLAFGVLVNVLGLAIRFLMRSKGMRDTYDMPIPAQVAMAVGVAACVVWLLRYRRRLIRCGRGQCEVCGYDLRGSPRGCPECGYGRGKE